MFKLLNLYTTEKDLSGKTIIVLYSGGWDSTALVAYLASKYGTINKPIIAVRNICASISRKQQSMEFAKVKLFKERCKELGLHVKFENMITSYNKITDEPINESVLQQLPMNIATSSNFFVYKNIAICYGFIRNDDMWHYKKETLELIDAFKAIYNNTDLVVDFPLEWTVKQQILDYLRENELLEYTWFCEHPKDSIPCGECLSCYRVNAETNYKFPEKINKEDK